MDNIDLTSENWLEKYLRGQNELQQKEKDNLKKIKKAVLPHLEKFKTQMAAKNAAFRVWAGIWNMDIKLAEKENDDLFFGEVGGKWLYSSKVFKIEIEHTRKSLDPMGVFFSASGDVLVVREGVLLDDTDHLVFNENILSKGPILAVDDKKIEHVFDVVMRTMDIAGFCERPNERPSARLRLLDSQLD